MLWGYLFFATYKISCINIYVQKPKWIGYDWRLNAFVPWKQSTGLRVVVLEVNEVHEVRHRLLTQSCFASQSSLVLQLFVIIIVVGFIWLGETAWHLPATQWKLFGQSDLPSPWHITWCSTIGGKGVELVRLTVWVVDIIVYEVDDVDVLESPSPGPIVVDGKSNPSSKEVSILVVGRRALFSSLVDGGVVVVFIVGPNISIRISFVPFGRVCMINTFWVVMSPGLVASRVVTSSSIVLTVVGSVGSILSWVVLLSYRGPLPDVFGVDLVVERSVDKDSLCFCIDEVDVDDSTDIVNVTDLSGALTVEELLLGFGRILNGLVGLVDAVLVDLSKYFVILQFDVDCD